MDKKNVQTEWVNTVETARMLGFKTAQNIRYYVKVGKFQPNDVIKTGEGRRSTYSLRRSAVEAMMAARKQKRAARLKPMIQE